MPVDATEHHLKVQCSARYYALGDLHTASECWFVLHGYGQLARFFIRPFAAMAEADRAVIAPEALSRFYVDAMHEHERVGASWMTKADRQHEIRDYVTYLDGLADHVRPAAEDRSTETCVLGFSQGAATACRWALLGTHDVDRLVLWAGGVPPDLDLAAHRAHLQQLDLIFVIGTDDEYISDECVAAEEARLDAHDISYRTIRFDGGHRIDPDVLKRVT